MSQNEFFAVLELLKRHVKDRVRFGVVDAGDAYLGTKVQLLSSFVTGNGLEKVKSKTNVRFINCEVGYSWGVFDNGSTQTNYILNELYFKGGPLKEYVPACRLNNDLASRSPLESQDHPIEYKSKILHGQEVLKAFGLRDNQEITDTRSFYEALFNLFVEEINSKRKTDYCEQATMRENQEGVIVSDKYEQFDGVLASFGERIHRSIVDCLKN